MTVRSVGPVGPRSTSKTRSFAFLRGVWQRLSWRNVGLALAIGFPLTTAQQFARNVSPSPWDLKMMQLYPMLPAAPWLDALATVLVCLAMLLGILAADEAQGRGAHPLPACVAGIVLGGLMGSLATSAIRIAFDAPVGFMARGRPAPLQPLIVWALAMTHGALVGLVYWRIQAMRFARKRRHDAEIARGDVRRARVESTLQAMQARVQPEFLFSTLDRIRATFDTRPQRASAMLDHLVAYLRAAVPHSRESTSTVAREAALARAFFDIRAATNGGGNALTIRIDDVALEATMPSMVMLPLLTALLRPEDEIAPPATGLALDVTVDERTLRILIEGLAPMAPVAELNGVFAATESRLQAIYGKPIVVEVERHATELRDLAVRVRLELPYEPSDGDPR